MSIRTSARLLSLFASSALAFPLLTGCGIGHITTTAPSSAIQGKVFGGQQPIGQSAITVWQVGSNVYGTGALDLADVQSDNNGNFSFPADAYTCPDPDTQVYITAAGGDPSPGVPNPKVLLAAGLGNCSTAQTQFVVINEVTTAATAYAMGHFFSPYFTTNTANDFSSSAADANYLALSNTHTIPMLVDLASGTALPSGNGVTREDTRLNTVANILAACVNNASLCPTLFNNTKNANGIAPKNTLQAAVSIALLPAQHVSTLYGLPTGTPPFTGLATQPDDFLLSVAYTSPDFGLSINSAYPGGSSSSIDIATDGRVFFPSNAAGKTGIGVFDPSLGGFSSLILANVLTLPQYVALDNYNTIFETDLGSSGFAAVDPNDYHSNTIGTINSDTQGSAAMTIPINYPFVSETATDGTTYLTADFPQVPAHRLTTLTAPATGLTVSDLNFFAMTSAVSGPCMLEEIDTADGSTFTDQVDLQTSSPCSSGGIFSIFGSGFGIASTPNETCVSGSDCEVDPNLSTPQGIAYDGGTSIWAANSGNASLYFSGAPGIFAFTHPSTLFKPYGIAVDGSGNVWLSNAGCVTTTTTPCNPGAFTLTEFIGAAAPTLTPVGNNFYGENAGTLPQANRHSASTSSRFTLPANKLLKP